VQPLTAGSQAGRGFSRCVARTSPASTGIV